MYNRKLIRRCLKRPNVRCDGTFIIVLSHLADELSYERNTKVAKHVYLGRVIPARREISSQTMTVSLMVIFDGFIQVRTTEGL